MGITGHTERHEVEAWVGGVELYASEEQRQQVISAIMEIPDAEESEWIAVMERVTA